jgi:hypothetical protein
MIVATGYHKEGQAMEKISVKAARQAAAIGKSVLVQGWTHAARQQGGLQLRRDQRRLLPGEFADHR